MLIAESGVKIDPDFRFNFERAFNVVEFESTNPSHSHPGAAAHRTATRTGILNGIRNVGYVPYEVSPSARSTEDGRRLYYDMRDLHHDFRNDMPDSKSALVFIDVDYYCDMPKYMHGDRPIVIYTFAPEQLAGAGNNAVWFTSGDVLVYKVDGGATYKHKLWNYEGDYLASVDEYDNLHAYSVAQYKSPLHPGRRVIVLSPTYVVPGPYWRHINTTFLERRNLCNLVCYKKDGVQWVSVPVGTRTPVSLPMDTFESLKARVRSSKDVTIGSIEYLLKSAKVTNASVVAPLLLEELKKERDTEDISDTAIIHHTLRAQTSYVHPADASSEHRPALQPSMLSVVTEPALAPVIGRQLEIEAVNQRLLDVKNVVSIPAQIQGFCGEFSRKLKPETPLASLTPDEVKERLNRPTQVAKASRILPWLTLDFLEAFIAYLKGEAQPKPGCPRLISEMDYQHNLVLACFAIPVAEYLKRFNFYGPGKTPVEICQRLAEVTQADPSGQVTMADFVKMDGSISAELRAYFTQWLLSCFDVSIGILLTRLQYEVSVGGRFRDGPTRPAGPDNKSGSWITGLLNFFVNAMLTYASYRLEGLSQELAWERLGIFFGDDNVTPYAPKLTEVCTKCGMGVTLEHSYDRVEFLSRIWPSPSTSTSSYCKPFRALAKIHLTRDGGPTQLGNKAMGYFTTDRETPLVGDLAKAILRVTDPDETTMSREEIYKINMPWPQEDKELIASDLYQYCEVDPNEAAEFITACHAVENFEDLSRLPVLTNFRPSATIDFIDNFGELNSMIDKAVADKLKLSKSSAKGKNVSSNHPKRDPGPTPTTSRVCDGCGGRSLNQCTCGPGVWSAQQGQSVHSTEPSVGSGTDGPEVAVPQPDGHAPGLVRQSGWSKSKWEREKAKAKGRPKKKRKRGRKPNSHPAGSG
jgi:hypothetical protein